MDTHVQRLGVWSMVFGITATVCSLLALWYFGGLFGVFNYSTDQRTGFVVTALVVVNLLLGPPCIACGYYLTLYDDRPHLAMIPVCVMNILNLPFGTILGIYGLWVLFTPETDPLFARGSRRSRHGRTV